MTTLERLSTEVNQLRDKLKNKLLGSQAQRSAWRERKRRILYVINQIKTPNQNNLTPTV